MHYCNLMSFVDGAMNSEEEKRFHLQRGCQVQNISNSYEISVPTMTLTGIFDKYGVKNIDLFSVKFSPVKSKIITGVSKTEMIESKFQKFLASQAD